MKNKKTLFAQSLEAVLKLAKDQGNLVTTAQVKEMFAEQELSDSQYKMIFDYLKKHKVGVDEAVDLDDYLTSNEKDFLTEYLHGLSRQRQYARSEKEEFLKRAMSGDKTAARTLAEVYLPEVAGIARLYADQGVLLEDLIGEGNMALTAKVMVLGSEETVEAAEALLMRRIMEAMEELIAATNHNRDIDARLVERVNAIAADAKELAESLGRKVTVCELAAEGKYSEAEIIEAIIMAGNDLEVI
jgi:RNA polymerase primary sigma factor